MRHAMHARLLVIGLVLAALGTATLPGQRPADAAGWGEVGAGDSHACALTRNGGVECWGKNYFGQLGDGTTSRSWTRVPVLVEPGGSPLGGVIAVAAGANHTCAIVVPGKLKCWGENGSRQLGDGTTADRFTPVDVSGIESGVAAVDGGWQHTCALTEAGGVKCWGGNDSGQLGDGTTTTRGTPVDVLQEPGAPTLTGVEAIAVGGHHSCAIVAGTGGVRCWGENKNGQLGDGTTEDRPTPVSVVGLAGDVVAISAGGEHTCALTDGGAVKCWGRNSEGQLGNGSTVDSATPVEVLGLATGASGISAGGWFGSLSYGPDGHTCAILGQGSGMKCWGNNVRGQLGDGSHASSSTPVDVMVLKGSPANLGLGGYSTCVVTTEGDLECWGAGRFAATGDVNCDACVDAVDAALVLQLHARVLTVTCGSSVADSNADCLVNSIDAALTLQFDAGLIDTLPHKPPSTTDPRCDASG